MANKKPIMISLSSGKGGVGKTSLSVNLSYALMNKGARVLLVDGDLGLANVDVMLGLSVKNTIRNILDKETDPLDAVIFLEQNLGVLPASSGVPEMVTLGPDEQKNLGEILFSVASGFDYVLIDTAAGIGPSVLWFNDFVSRNLVILTPDPTSLTDAYAFIKTISNRYNRDLFYLILNNIKKEQEDRRIFNRLEEVVTQYLKLQLKYLGAVPNDQAVSKAVYSRIPFIKNSPDCSAAMAVSRLADGILALN
jgi:flagellar biosynthesis protein FlhG